MAHFAKIGMNGKVINVLTLADNDMLDANDQPQERVGQQYLEKHHSWPADMWVQTSYNTFENTHNSGDNSNAFRGNFASVGFTWDEENQIFWRPKPHASWVKDIATAKWKAPVGDAPSITAEQQAQNDANTHFWYYEWNEDAGNWELSNSIR
jgi:hypothetical protein